jgi:hypothetical protein
LWIPTAARVSRDRGRRRRVHDSARFRQDTADNLVLIGAVSIIVFGFMSLFFASVYTSTNGIPTEFDDYPEQGLEWHWIAAAIRISAVKTLAVSTTSRYRAHKRSKRNSPLESVGARLE